MAALTERVTIQSNGASLSGTLFRPEGRHASAIVIHSAVGVPHNHYRHFATWAAGRGHLCLTYDYRDFGASASVHPRRSSATMADWGVHDQAAALALIRAEAGGAPVRVIGHSLGGFMMPFHEEMAGVEKITTVASGPAYWCNHPWHYMPAVIAFWFAVGPPATALAGYLPGRAIGLGADLPAGVYWQWRRWCTSKAFYIRDVGTALPEPDFQRFAGPMKRIAIEDDVMIPPSAVAQLDRFYPAARIERMTLSPRAYGLSRIGHLGPFAERNTAVWETILP